MYKKAIVLFSGGLDSTTCLAIARKSARQVYALTVDYGQNHSVEIKVAKRWLAKHAPEVIHKVVQLELPGSAASALTGVEKRIKKDGKIGSEIPNTFVPYRNLLLIGLAANWAAAVGAGVIYTGVNAVDYSGYPDCRPEFIQKIQAALREATRTVHKVAIKTPLLFKTKVQIIAQALKEGVNLKETHSCYAPSKKGGACGKCESCVIRAAAIKEMRVICQKCSIKKYCAESNSRLGCR